MHSLAEGVTDLSSAEIAEALHRIDSNIRELNQYRSGVPEGIIYNMHTLLEKIGASERDIALPPYVAACLVETTKAFDKTDERALGAAALLPMNGSRLYDLDHYRKIDDTPPPAA